MVDEIIPASNVSSNPEGIDKLSEPDDSWESTPGDDKPTITINVSEDNKPIKTITVRNTTNVKKIIITVTDENGDNVSSK